MKCLAISRIDQDMVKKDLFQAPYLPPGSIEAICKKAKPTMFHLKLNESVRSHCTPNP